MSSASETGDPTREETLLLLNRATVVMHSVRTAAHDLSNAFQMVSGSAEMMASLADLPPRAATRLDAIQRHVEKCHGIVQRLAALARRDGSGARPVDVGQAVGRALEARRYEHSRLGITVTVEKGETAEWIVRADPQDLDLLLLNLIINAEQAVAGRQAPSIRLSLARSAETIDVRVEDNGPGVADAAGDVFAPYVTTAAGTAAGLGLTAARLLAGHLGGTVTRDAAVSGWTGFLLRLPASPAAS